MTYSQRIRQNLHPTKPELILENIPTIYFNLLFLMYIKKHAARIVEQHLTYNTNPART